MKKLTNLLLISLFFGLLFFTQTVEAQVEMPKENDLYSLDQVHELRINFDRNDWRNALDSIRITSGGMMLAQAQIDGKTYKNVGVRYRGKRSFRTGDERNPLQIRLNYRDFYQHHQGYKNLKLSAALRDPSMVREVMAFEMVRKYMPAPKAAFTEVFVNGDYYGLFVNIEPVDGGFLGRNFDANESTFIKADVAEEQKKIEGCKQNTSASLEDEKSKNCFKNNYELKSNSGWDDLKKLTETLNNDVENIDKILDVDNVLWMLAMNNVLVNLSSYSGQHSENYYLYKNRLGKFTPIMWDMNLAFGSFKNTGKGSDLNNKELMRLDPFLHENSETRPLISQLLKNKHYKKVYLSHIRTLIYDNFLDDSFEKRAKELHEQIRPSFIKDKNNSYTVEDFDASLEKTIGTKSKIPGIVSFITKRAQFLKKHDNLNVLPPEVAEIKFKERDKFTNVPVSDFNIQVKINRQARQVKVFYRYEGSQPFKMIFLNDDGKSFDGSAGDQVFGGVIASNGYRFIEYYLVLENALSVGFDPPNYMWELHTADLSELNK